MMTITQEYSGLHAGLNKGISIKRIGKQISLKNAVKVVKFAAPIATSLIPVGGGVVSKLMNSKVGKVVGKVKNSKTGATAIKIAKTAKQIKNTGVVSIPRAQVIPNSGLNYNKVLSLGSKGNEVKQLQVFLGLKPDGVFGPQTLAALRTKTGKIAIKLSETLPVNNTQVNLNSFLPATTTNYGSATANLDLPIIQQGGKSVNVQPMETIDSSMQETSSEPLEDVTAAIPVKEVSGEKLDTSLNTEPKDNTLLYVGAAVGVGALIYFATKNNN